jgi:hypothetical protein
MCREEEIARQANAVQPFVGLMAGLALGRAHHELACGDANERDVYARVGNHL